MYDIEEMNIDFPVYGLPMDPENFEYPLFMSWFTANANWDIGISPFKNHDFNNAKSYIKYLDYAAIQAAGVYSAIDEYQKIIQPGKNGLLAENTMNWEENLLSLIEKKDLRESIQSNAYNELLTKHTIQKNENLFIKTIQNILHG